MRQFFISFADFTINYAISVFVLLIMSAYVAWTNWPLSDISDMHDVGIDVLNGTIVTMLSVIMKKLSDISHLENHFRESWKKPEVRTALIGLASHLSCTRTYDSDGVFLKMLLDEFSGFNRKMSEYGQGKCELDRSDWSDYWKELVSGKDHYYSTALVASPKYWDDSFGKMAETETISMARMGKQVTKIYILTDPNYNMAIECAQGGTKELSNLEGEEKTNMIKFLGRIKLLYDAGVSMRFCRYETAADGAFGLAEDIGIYGDRAVGVQHFSSAAPEKTEKFTLYFGSEIQDYTRRFKKLENNSEKYENLRALAGM